MFHNALMPFAESRILMKRNNYIQILKFIACILITNSHCIYPKTVFSIAGATSIFQIGGGWGNAIFFVVSGFLVGGSCLSFSEWMTKRYVRILPLTIAMGSVWYCINLPKVNFVLWLCTCFWFVSAIALYYPIFYVLDRMKNGYLVGIFSWIIGYVIFYALVYDDVFFVEANGFSWFKIYSFFGVMVVGGLVKRKINRVKTVPYRLLVVGILCSGLLWVGEYAIIIFCSAGYICQFVITISRILFSFCIIAFALKLDDDRHLVLSDSNIIFIIADSTLEIYIVQLMAKEIIEKYVITPWNMIFFWGVAIFVGILVHKVTEAIIKIKELSC